MYVGDEVESESNTAIYLSWYMHTNTPDMFLPELGGNELLEDKRFVFGGKLWGDATGFHQMNVEIQTEHVVHHLKCELDPDLRRREDASFLNSTIAPEVPLLAKPRGPSRHGLTKAMLDELLFYSIPSLLPFTEELIVRFGQVYDRTNFQTVYNTEAALREIVAALILTSRGIVVDKANLLFDLFGHYDPDKPNVGRFHKSYDMDPYRIGPDAAQSAEKLYPFLPEGALKSIAKDPSSRPNCISLAECTALVQTLLLRNLIHVDNMQAFQMAATLFDPLGNVPRIVQAKIDTANGLQRDVTGCFIRFVSRECAETGLYGINFTRNTNLKATMIKDPFPGISKKLHVLVSRDGSMDLVDKITVEIDGKGEFITGAGGNFNDSLHQVQRESELPRHLQKMGTFSKRQLEMPSDHPLAEACYIFDYHYTVIDKFSFIIKFMASDLLTEPLRRVTAMERWFTPRVEMSLDVKLDIPVNTKALDSIAPLNFQLSDLSDFARGSNPQMSEFVDLQSEYPSPPNFTPISVHAAAKPVSRPMISATPLPIMRPVRKRDRLDSRHSKPSQKFSQFAVHAAAHEVPIPAFVKVKIVGAHGLYDVNGNGKQNPYCKLAMGSQHAATKIAERGNLKPIWNEQFQLYYMSDSHTSTFTVFDSTTDGATVGEGNVDVISLLKIWSEGKSTNVPIAVSYQKLFVLLILIPLCLSFSLSIISFLADYGIGRTCGCR